MKGWVPIMYKERKVLMAERRERVLAEIEGCMQGMFLDTQALFLADLIDRLESRWRRVDRLQTERDLAQLCGVAEVSNDMNAPSGALGEGDAPGKGTGRW
jgi:hypothetical protein